MRQSLVGDVAEKLKTDISAGDEAVLPSMQELASRYGVSTSTMAKVARILKEQGVITFVQGQRIHVVGRRLPSRNNKRAPERLYDLIRGRISAQTYRTGTPLPKRQALAMEQGACATSVTKACIKLAREGILHKRGRQWVVGPELKKTSANDSQIPVMLLISKRDFEWQVFASQDPTSSFCQAFSHEIDHHNVEILPVLTETHETPKGFICAGPEAARFLLKQLGNRYIGALIISVSIDTDQLRQWCSFLQKFRMPVVCFDGNKLRRENEQFDKLFTRLFCSIPNVVRTALVQLTEQGHSKIAYISSYTDPWHHELRFLFEKIAPEFSDLEISMPGAPADLSKAAGGRLLMEDATFAEIFREFAHSNFDSTVSDKELDKRKLKSLFRHFSIRGVETLRALSWFMRQLRMEVPGLIHDFRAVLSNQNKTLPDGLKAFLAFLADDKIAKRIRLNHHQLTHPLPGFTEAISNKETTAIIASSDSDAKFISSWLFCAGVKIPERISVLSLGNKSSLTIFPITTIDWGYSALGYDAFHLILGDGNVKRPSNGQCSANPTVVNRGSVGPPRRGDQLIELR